MYSSIYIYIHEEVGRGGGEGGVLWSMMGKVGSGSGIRL